MYAMVVYATKVMVISTNVDMGSTTTNADTSLFATKNKEKILAL